MTTRGSLVGWTAGIALVLVAVSLGFWISSEKFSVQAERYSPDVTGMQNDLAVEASEILVPKAEDENAQQIEGGNSVVIGRLVDSSQIPGMDEWIDGEFIPSLSGREIANARVLEIDISSFSSPQEDANYILGLAENKRLEMTMTRWRPSKHGGGSWFGSVIPGQDRIILHIDHLGNLRGTLMLPGEAWAITSTPTPPYHVAYQLIDATFLTD